jgi:hypothetical protein
MQTNLQQRLDHVISKVHQELLDKQVLVPVYEKGKIIVGSVWIVSKEASKDIVKDNKLVYTSVALNKTAIALANMLAIVGKTTHQTDMLYRADQQYAVYMQETLFFKSKYKIAIAKKKYDQADIFFARYEHAKEKANSHKNYVLTLIAY